MKKEKQAKYRKKRNFKSVRKKNAEYEMKNLIEENVSCKQQLEYWSTDSVAVYVS